MKSPTRSVGTIDDDGILNGSTRNERSRNTIRITGKKLTEYSTHQGCLAAPPRRLRSHKVSSAHTRPVTTSRISRNKAKFITAGRSSTFAPLQHREKRFLRNLHRTDLLHALLPFFLLIQKFALAGDIAAIAFRKHVLAQRLDVLARDDVAADRRLDGDVEHLPRDQAAQPLDQLAAAALRRLAMHHGGKRVDALAVHEDVEAHHVGRAVLLELVVERAVAARHGLQAVEEVEHHF